MCYLPHFIDQRESSSTLLARTTALLRRGRTKLQVVFYFSGETTSKLIGWGINRDQNGESFLLSYHSTLNLLEQSKTCFGNIFFHSFFLSLSLFHSSAFDATPEICSMFNSHLKSYTIKNLDIFTVTKYQSGWWGQPSLSITEAFFVSIDLRKSHENSLDTGCVNLCVYIFFQWHQIKENIKDQIYSYSPQPFCLSLGPNCFVQIFCLVRVYLAIV